MIIVESRSRQLIYYPISIPINSILLEIQFTAR